MYYKANQERIPNQYQLFPETCTVIKWTSEMQIFHKWNKYIFSTHKCKVT